MYGIVCMYSMWSVCLCSVWVSACVLIYQANTLITLECWNRIDIVDFYSLGIEFCEWHP